MIDADMAHAIMGGLSMAYSEGLTGISEDWEESRINSAEERVIQMLYEFHPEIVKLYHYYHLLKKVLV